MEIFIPHMRCGETEDISCVKLSTLIRCVASHLRAKCSGTFELEKVYELQHAVCVTSELEPTSPSRLLCHRLEAVIH